jgi:hypothetical protein
MTRQLPEGYTVEYEHRRRRLRDGVSIHPRGGKTIAYVFNADRVLVATGEALCLSTENYNRKLGAQIALARALMILEGTERKRVLKHATKLEAA